MGIIWLIDDAFCFVWAKLGAVDVVCCFLIEGCSVLDFDASVCFLGVEAAGGNTDVASNEALGVVGA